MALQIRTDGDIAILSHIGHLMNDPRYSSVTQDVNELLDEGHRRFVLELADVRDTGTSLLGVLVSISRTIKKAGGTMVLARVSRPLWAYLEEMRLDDEWDVYPSVDQAVKGLRPHDDEESDEEEPGDLP